MKRLQGFFLIWMLAACTGTQVSETPSLTAAKAIPTNPSLPLNLAPTVTAMIAPTVTPTQESVCDPFRVDFCIMDGHFILERPIHPPGNDSVDPTYLYGSTANRTREPHHGVELPNASGTPVYAAAMGVVIFAGPDHQALYCPWANFYGNVIVIQHEDRLATVYAHLSKIDVEQGQKVFAGEKIGEVGKTGVAIGSHLHFEVRRGNAEDYFATQNPELWLAPVQDASGKRFGVLMISVVDQNHNLIPSMKFTLRYYQESSTLPVKSYYGTTYSSDMLTNGEENAVVGNLPAGQYRIAMERDGQIYERWLEVESGKLTQVALIMK